MGEHLMLHIGACVKTLSDTDIRVNTLCFIAYRGRRENIFLHIGAGVKTLSDTDIGVNSLFYI